MKKLTIGIFLLTVHYAAFAAETSIVERGGFFRTHYTFQWPRWSPQLVIPKREAYEKDRRLKKTTLRMMERLGLDPKKDDWLNHLYEMTYGSNGNFNTRIRNSPPPASWFAPEFDDSNWLHRRGFFSDEIVQRISTRSWFRVRDPKKATLKLFLVYRGGVRVFLNGKEIARAHLPKGKLHHDTVATPYPEDAYFRSIDEFEPGDQKKLGADLKDPSSKKHYLLRLVQGLPWSWEKERVSRKATDSQPELRYLRAFNGSVTRKTYERVREARNRVLEMTLPQDALKQGGNLLAIEIRRSDMNPIMRRTRQRDNRPRWRHVHLGSLKLTGDGDASAVSGLDRPAGLQAWVRDVNARTWSTDFHESGAPVGKISLVGARNGTYGGQLSVGSPVAITGVQLSHFELASDHGQSIKPENICIYPIHPRTYKEMGMMTGTKSGRAHVIKEDKVSRSRGGRSSDGKTRSGKHYSHIDWGLESKNGISAKESFDLKADFSRSFWVSVRVPGNTKPGLYKGSIQVQAKGQTPVVIPLSVEVTAWKLPDPRDYRTDIGGEQSPYGVAKHYKVPLWSDEHFKLMESSFYHMGRLGNDWLNVPVLINTEFGNGDDMMISFTRKADGSLSFSYEILDRYLDLALRYWGTPEVINFIVQHGTGANPSEVFIFNEKTNAKKLVQLNGTNFSREVRREVWSAFSRSLYSHMKKRGLDKSMCWGFAWDLESDPSLRPLLKGFVPSVKWTRGSHTVYPDKYHRAVSAVYSGPFGAQGRHGWNKPFMNLVNPRRYSKTINVRGHSEPFLFRVWPDRAMTSGRTGIGRFGTDYGTAYQDHFSMNNPSAQPGFSVRNTYYFGKTGAETSVQAEVLLEGIQETEARIFLERVAAYELVSEDLTAEIKQTLKAHYLDTAFLPVKFESPHLADICSGWRARSEKLYRLAGKVALKTGLDLSQYSFVGERVPAKGSKSISLKLTNFRDTPQNWTVSECPAWIKPEKKKVVVNELEQLQFVLDTNTLKPESTESGSIVLKNESENVTRSVSVQVLVGELMYLPMETINFFAPPKGYRNPVMIRGEDKAVFNVQPGTSTEKSFSLTNSSGSVLNWKASGSEAWLKVSPAKGSIPPGESFSLKLTATAPKSGSPSRLEAELQISEEGGLPPLKKKVVMYSIPKYTEPAVPTGKSKMLKSISGSHVNKLPLGANSSALYQYKIVKGKPTFTDEGKTKVASLPQRSSYNIKGKGIRGFSARVEVVPYSIKTYGGKIKGRPLDTQVAFEIHVDGKIVATSGLMKLGDKPRLLVAKSLGNAKVLQLITRFDVPELQNINSYDCGLWKDARVYMNKE